MKSSALCELMPGSFSYVPQIAEHAVGEELSLGIASQYACVGLCLPIVLIIAAKVAIAQ
jgi:hypothetical protein